jgi:hypothetical protein
VREFMSKLRAGWNLSKAGKILLQRKISLPNDGAIPY